MERGGDVERTIAENKEPDNTGWGRGRVRHRSRICAQAAAGPKSATDRRRPISSVLGRWSWGRQDGGGGGWLIVQFALSRVPAGDASAKNS